MKILTKIILNFAILLLATKSIAQIGISATAGYTPSSNAMLDINSSTKGLLIPRMTTAQRTTLTTSATDGLTVYDTQTKSFWFYNSATATWVALATGGPWLGAGNDIYNTNIGNVGIGSNSPTGKLHIESAGNASEANSSMDPHLRIKLTNDANYLWNRFENSDGARSFSHRYDLFSGGSNYSIYYNTTRRFSINNNGNVGIGLNLGAYPLDVTGDINTTGNLRVNGNAGVAGNILKKDASNALSWQPQLTGFSAIGTAPAISNEQSVPTNTPTQITILNNEQYDTDNMYNPATGNITISAAGIYHIDAKLHLDGADIGIHTLNLERQILGGGVFSTLRLASNEITVNNIDSYIIISADIQFFLNDTVRLMYNHNCAGNQYITGSFFSWVNMHKLN